MTVYGDLLFLINFSMDFLCFYLSCLLLHRKLSPLRACIASAIGGVYSVAVLFVQVSAALALVIDILVLILMCAVVFAQSDTKFFEFVKKVLLYLFASSLLGGFMTVIFNLLNRLDILVEDGVIKEGLEVWIFALLAILSAMITVRGGRLFRASRGKEEAYLLLEMGGDTVRLSTLLDSGNLVCEPISGKGVAFVALEECKTILPLDMYSCLARGRSIEDMPMRAAMRMRLIPSKTVSGEALLPAIKPDGAILICGKRKKELDIYVAFVGGKDLSGYGAIISSECII